MIGRVVTLVTVAAVALGVMTRQAQSESSPLAPSLSAPVALSLSKSDAAQDGSAPDAGPREHAAPGDGGAPDAGEPEPDQDLLEHLDILQNLELLQHLELFDTGAPGGR